MFLLNYWLAFLAIIAPLFDIVTAQSNGTAGGYFAITGVQTGINDATGELPARRNILDLQNDQPAWSLYIQALNAMQTTDESDPLSWFQIAGIHGRPFIPWNHFNQYEGAQYNWWKGYCTHVSVLFTSWHRPYLALLEQVIGQNAQRIAKTYTGSDLPVFQDAADKLRMPYWDWAASPEMPPVLSQPTVQIETPAGDQTVNNPLFQYKFQQFPLNPTYFPPDLDERAKRPFTVRQPESGDPNSASRPEVINAQLLRGNFMQRTWDALVKSTDYNSISTESTGGSSVEAIHDSIHGMIGGDHGHMTRLEYSAFDPIFWLHHTNVDRLYAIWMAMNPGKIMIPLARESGTMSIPSGNNDNTDTPLWPFTSDSAGTVYTSSSSYELSTFGYTYPEIGDWSQTPDNLKNNVTAQVNAKYDPNSIFRNAPSLRSRDTFRPGEETVEWSVSISVSKFDLAGTHFAIRLFLGTVPSNPQDWPTCDSGLGSMQIMPPVIKNATSTPAVIVHDEFSLTKAIVEAGHNVSEIPAVKKYLKDSLQWRVQKLDGTVVDVNSLPSLNVTVSDQTVTLQQNITSLPNFGLRTVHQEITDKPATEKPLAANAGSRVAGGRLLGLGVLFVFAWMILM